MLESPDTLTIGGKEYYYGDALAHSFVLNRKLTGGMVWTNAATDGGHSEMYYGIVASRTEAAMLEKVKFVGDFYDGNFEEFRKRAKEGDAYFGGFAGRIWVNHLVCTLWKSTKALLPGLPILAEIFAAVGQDIKAYQFEFSDNSDPSDGDERFYDYKVLELSAGGKVKKDETPEEIAKKEKASREQELKQQQHLADPVAKATMRQAGLIKKPEGFGADKSMSRAKRLGFQTPAEVAFKTRVGDSVEDRIKRAEDFLS